MILFGAVPLKLNGVAAHTESPGGCTGGFVATPLYAAEQAAVSAPSSPRDQAADRPAEATRASRLRHVPDILALAAYVVLSLYLTAGLWRNPNRRALSFLDGGDELLLQWYLAHSAHAVTHLSNPFFTTDMNASAGVNLAGNASVLGLGIPLTPLTMAAGAGVTTCVVVTGSLALTALAWYWLLSRPLALHRGAAMIGGLFCGFAPPLIAESSYGHQHIVAQFLVPIIAWRFIRLAQRARPIRNGVIFGALVAYQALIGEEVLLFTAVAVLIFALAYALQRPREARVAIPAVVRGLLVAALVAAVLLAVPLAYQFFGPQHYTGNPIDPQPFHANVRDYLGIPAPTPFWSAGAVGRWGFQSYPVLGLPIVLVLLVFSWPLRRNVIFVSSLAVLAVAAVLSLGTRVTVWHSGVGLPGPWRLVARLPVFEWVVPERIGQLAVPAVGVAIGLILDRALARWRQGVRFVPAAAILTTTAALATLTPTPLPTIALPPIPHFVSDGTWREFVPPGRSLVTVPAPSLASFAGMRWASASRGDIAIPGGYFLGPSADGKKTLFGPPLAWTTTMLNTVASTGQVWRVVPADREQLLHDLRYWKASVLVLAPDQHNAAALRATVEEFLGPARPVSDVLIWDVRELT
jgi:hypothetical protein